MVKPVLVFFFFCMILFKSLIKKFEIIQKNHHISELFTVMLCENMNYIDIINNKSLHKMLIPGLDLIIPQLVTNRTAKICCLGLIFSAILHYGD